MLFVSTRGEEDALAFSDIVLKGLCSDGGLAMPDHIPHFTLDEIESFRSLNYAALALTLMTPFCTDIPTNDLSTLLQRAYQREIFGSEEIVSTTKLDEQSYILGLSNGPTFAFKDMAMQFLGVLFPYILEKNNTTLNILGATSGDTGSSAIHAMRNKDRINVFMLSPHQRMSAFQAAQMYSVQDPNIFNIAIKGVFDDCQDLVKILNHDKAFKNQFHLGAVNSINWARILAQIVYYFKGYLAVTEKVGAAVDFVVPSGNFGNIFAGIMARAMGLPIRKLILATNENNVLDEFFQTGVYQPRKTEDVYMTSSPSMDIAKASNFERFIYLMAGSDKTRQLWKDIDDQGFFDLRKDALWQTRSDWNIDSGRSTHQNRLETIREIYHQYGVVVDPHTADGIHVAKKYRVPGVIQVYLETAKPVKFADTIQEALGAIPESIIGDQKIESLPQHFEVMEANAEHLKDYLRMHIR